MPLSGDIPLPMSRTEPRNSVETGLRSIDGLLTIGTGQRMGIFAASGVGKTTLIQQLAYQIDCDVCVVCLVGERGREVQTFWQKLSESKQAEKYCCVAATSDVSAPLRSRAVNQAVSPCRILA